MADSDPEQHVDHDAPNAVEKYRRDHPDILDRVAGDLAPGLTVVRDPYRQTSHLIKDFLKISPKRKDRDCGGEQSPSPEE